MAKLRKMLGSPDSPYIISLMRLIETQSKHTISSWAVSYTQQVMLPIYEKSALKSDCVKSALETAQAYLAKEKKLAEAKAAAKEVMAQAKQPGLSPSEQAAVRAHRSAPFPHRPAHWGCVFMRQQLWPMTGLESKKRMRHMNRLPQKNVRRCIRDFKKLQ